MRKNLSADDLSGLLNQPRCAVLATNYADGTTLLSPVWHEWRDWRARTVRTERCERVQYRSPRRRDAPRRSPANIPLCSKACLARTLDRCGAVCDLKLVENVRDVVGNAFRRQ